MVNLWLVLGALPIIIYKKRIRMKWSISSAIVAMLMLVICVSCSNNIFDDDKSLVGGVSDVGVLRVEMERPKLWASA